MSYSVISSQLICAKHQQEYPMMVRAEGACYYDDKGKEYIDASGATACVTNLGHGNEAIAKALYEQTKTLSVHPTHSFYSPVVENYLRQLTEFAPAGFNKAWTISGGTEAVENAIKLAYQYHVMKGKTRSKILARWGSYHGNSIFVLDAGGMKVRRDFYEPLMKGFDHVSSCLPYRAPEGMSEQEYEDSLIAEFKTQVEKHPGDYLCFLAEPIVGAALGAAVPTENYFKRIREICDEHDILMIADEVMTGFGRTGERFGHEHFGAQFDILACAKGISGGYFPLGAIIAHDKVMEVIEGSNQPFYSGQTYSCIPQAAAVGIAVLEEYHRQDLITKSRDTGAYLKEKLAAIDSPYVGDVRGKGLFLGVEFVEDKATKKEFDPTRMIAKNIERAAQDKGVILYACRGTVELSRGDHLLIVPPLCLEKQQADKIADVIAESINEVIS